MAGVNLRSLPLVVAGVALLAGCAVVNPTSATPGATSTSAPEPSAVTASSTTRAATPSASGTPSTKASGPAPTTGQSADAQAATQLMPGFLAYYAAADQVLQAGGAGAPTTAMLDTMTGAALDGWTGNAAEFKAKGYKQSGATKVESFSPGALDRASGTASVDFCANSTDVSVTDAAGATIAPADPANRAMGGTANLVYSGGHWRVLSLAGLTPIAACP
jgi:hypothetical protein